KFSFEYYKLFAVRSGYLMEWKIRPVELELAFTWAISRSSSTHKTNFLIEAIDTHPAGLEIVGQGEVAWNRRFGESAEQVRAQFASVQAQLGSIQSLEELERAVLGLTPSLRCGLICAYLDLQCLSALVPSRFAKTYL